MNKAVKFTSVVLLSMLLSVGVAAKTLKFATLAPAGTTWMKEMTAGADRVKQRTDGRVKLKFYPGGVMGNDQSVHRKIKIGQLHGGAFTQAGLSQANNSIQAMGLPMLFRSLDEVDYVRERMDPVLKQEMESSGFVLLGISEGGFARILSKQPMQDLEALRSSKVWVPEGDEVGLTVFKGLGITPISLPISDVFTGLQTGLIETVPVNPTSAIAFQWHSSTAYMTDVPITFLIGVLAITKSEFDKLSVADQAVLREEMGAVFKRLDKINRIDNEAARAALQQHGINFVMPNPGEIERWREISAKSVDEMVKEGVISAHIVEQVRGYLRTYRNQQ
ncbi:MAG: TRAP transporter substrate-binding protein DctP [Gammaproteobacteria bacterium]|jgi:TRAP-type C4-dicarboxylate transport system substrate-binding protein|nr:TRAP transporter substrate-binding protein DctP [Gammaproteobacteria bacterium]